MRHRVVLVIMVACVLGACANRSAITGSSTTQPGRAASSASPVATSPSITDTTSTYVCAVITPEAVQTSFGETAPLTTQPMLEARGPACGYPYPQGGGYLMVVQFQDPATWDEYAGTGRPVEGLKFEALYSPVSYPEALFIRDIERGAVIMLLAPQNTTSDLDSLLKVAGHIYGTTPEGIHVETT